MSRRFLDRAFSQAQFREGQRNARRHKKPQRKANAEQQTEDRTASNAVEKIISAADKQDWLKVLDLPLPDVDELGNPVWPYGKSDISRKYRQMCLLVHPDKNAGERARHAFQLLSKAYKTMLNENKRYDILKSACVVALEAKEKREAKATVDEKIKINAEKIAEKRKLNKIQHEKFSSEIVRQIKERQTQSSMKKRKIANSRFTAKQKSQHQDSDSIEDLVEDLDQNEKESAPLQCGEAKHVETARDRVKNKLKSKAKDVHTADEDIDHEEWQGAVFNKTKQQRRKPHFMF